MQNTENKSKKYVALATYVVAVLCLLAGLFLPLFDGKNLLALKLGDVFKSLLNKAADPNPFTRSCEISLFGIDSLKFDFTALVIALYTAVTALALLAFIPVAFSVLKEGKAAKKFYYGIEAAAVIVLSLYFLVSLKSEFGDYNDYNMVIALGGTALTLIVLCGLDKGKASAVKIILFLLSAIGFLALFDFVTLLKKQDEFSSFTDKISSVIAGTESGVSYLEKLYAKKFSDTLSAEDFKNKLLLIFAVITATVALINFFIDTVKLATRKDGKIRNIFNIARYGLELVAAAGTLIMALVCKEKIGLMLIAISAVAAICLAISIVRLIVSILKKPESERAAEADEDFAVEENYGGVTVTEPVEEPATEEFKFDDYTAPDEFADDGYKPEDEYTAPDTDVYEEPVPADDYIQPVEEPVEEPVAEQTEEPAEAISEQPVQEETPEETPVYVRPEEVINDYELETEATYLIPAEEHIEEPVEEPVIIPAEVPFEEITEVPEEITLDTEVTKVSEPEALGVIIEEAEAVTPPEEIEETDDSDDGLEDTVQKTYNEVIEPYNPYEKRNNPFRTYEPSSQPVQPYNPYAAQQEAARRDRTGNEKAQPARTVNEQKPAQTYKPYERTADKAQPSKPLQPRPIIQEFKPVPPVSEQPAKETRVYTIDTIYAGPTDDFIRKLSNDERIEFARTFIEKNRGDLGNIPDYVVGGNNKKFFSVAFIYLGRIRGLVSDGLLNKMYKELNML